MIAGYEELAEVFEPIKDKQMCWINNSQRLDDLNSRNVLSAQDNLTCKGSSRFSSLLAAWDVSPSGEERVLVPVPVAPCMLKSELTVDIKYVKRVRLVAL